MSLPTQLTEARAWYGKQSLIKKVIVGLVIWWLFRRLMRYLETATPTIDLKPVSFQPSTNTERVTWVIPKS